MNATMKRVGALLLAAIASLLCAAALLPATVSAAYADEPTVNVTYKGIEAGDTLNAYKVVSFSGDNNNAYAYDATFEAFLTASEADGGMGYASASDFEKLAVDSDDLKTVLNKFVAYSGFKSMTPAIAQVSAGTSVAADYAPGYYVIAPTTATGHNTVYSASSLFVRYNGNSDLLVYGNGSKLTATDGKYEINVKSQNGATLKKSIARANGKWAATKTVSMGEYVQYGLQITLPDYSEIAFDLNVTVDDTLTNLQFVEGDAAHPVKAYAGTSQATGAEFDGVTVTAGDYDATTHTQKLTFKIDYSKLTGGEKTLMISYWALPTADMVSGGTMNGTNGATLSYKTTAADDSVYTTAASNTTVYTYAMKLTKLGSLSNAPLEGAEFELYADATTTQPMRFIPVYKTGSTTDVAYYQYTTDATATGSVTTLVAGTDGTFEIRGIDGAESKPIYIKETKTPQGYAAPAGRFIATLKSATDADTNEHNGKLDSGTFTAENTADAALAVSATVDNANQWQLDVQLNNANTNALPTTGGMGTVIFTVAGIALMLAAAGAFVVLRRRNQR